MTVPRQTLAIAIALLLTAPFALAAGPSGPKLYHWIGKDGKPHYSDVLPPEALAQARQELSKTSGVAINQVDRAQTPEERAAAVAKAEADAKTAEEVEKAKQSEQVLLASYPTEADLQRAYDQRITLQTETLKSTRIGMGSQQQSLSSMLIEASNRELAGRPVTPQLANSIQSIHKQVVDMQALLIRQEAQSVSLHQESAAMIAHYRALRTAADALQTAPSDAPSPKPAGGG